MSLPTTGRKALSIGDIRHVALDLDGTIYKGETLFETTEPFLSLLKDLGIGYTFLTNNPSKSPSDYLKRLTGFGLSVTESDLYSSTQATIEFLRERWPGINRLFVLGTPSMCSAFEASGFTLMSDDPKAEPDGVVVGFDTTLVYSRLCRAAWWIKQQKPFFATNPDRVCPTDEPTILVDCGSLCAALEAATGRSPTRVLGKPDPAMVRGILRRHSLQTHQLAVVGDRLYTDIEMARRAGAFGILVLTGETTASATAEYEPQPDLAVEDLAELGAKIREVHLQRVVA